MAGKEMIAKIILRAQADGSVQRAFEQAGKYSDTYITKLEKIGTVAKRAFQIVSTAVVTGSAACVNAAIEFESAFAGVMKTVEETDTTTYADLSEGIRELSKVTPATATEIAAVAEAAGQLGIKADDILNFSKVMIDLGESTNLSSDEAATSIAKLFNVTGTSMDYVDEFGSTLVALGNNAATTESDILAMATRIAGSGTQIGLTEQQILALATSLSSVGIEAEMGGSAISTTMTQIDKDVALNSANVETWAKTAGMSASEFKKAWQTDAYGALQKIIQGMGETKDAGGNLNVLLEDLGINSIRQSDTMKRLSRASGLMSEMTDLANKSWEENYALTKEANTRYATMASKLEMLKNTFTDLAITIGEKLMPYVDKFVTWLQGLDFDAIANKITGCIDWIIEHGEMLAGIASVIGGAFAGVKLAGFIKGIISAVKIIAACVKSFGALKAIMATLGGPITIILAVVGALVAGFIYLWNNCEGFRNFFIGMWEGIKNACAAVGNWFSTFFTVTIPSFFSFLWEKIQYVGGVIANFFTVTIPEAFNKVVAFFQQLPSKIGTWLSGVWQSISAWGINLWNKAVEIGKNFVDGVVNFFKDLPYKIGFCIGFVIGKIIQFGQKLWNFATVTIPEFIGKVVEWFKQLPGRIWTWLVNAWNKVSTWGVNLWNKAIEIGSNVINSIVNFFATLPSKIWAWLVNAWNKVSAWGANMWAKAVEIGSNVINAVVDFFVQLPGKIWTWLCEAANKVVQWGSDLMAKGIQAATDLYNGIVEKVSEIPGKMLEFGKNIIEGLWNGISNAGEWLWNQISGFCGGIVDGIASALGISSPSEVMEKLFKWVPIGAGLGIEKNTKYAVKAVNGMGGEITAAASRISPTISTSTRLQKFGTGGTVTSPQAAIVGDRPETIVPHGNTTRNRALLAEAARGVGATGGTNNTFAFTFAPVIYGNNVEENRAMIQDEREAFERQMEAWLAKNRRLAF